MATSLHIPHSSMKKIEKLNNVLLWRNKTKTIQINQLFSSNLIKYMGTFQD